MPLFIVETVRLFRHTYAVQCEKGEYAADYVTCEEVEEFGQADLGETITSIREATTDDYLSEFDKIAEYLKDWSPEQKMRFIKKCCA